MGKKKPFLKGLPTIAAGLATPPQGEGELQRRDADPDQDVHITVLHYTELNCITQPCTILHNPLLHYTELYCTTQPCTTLHTTLLYCTTLYYTKQTVLYYTIVYYTT